MQVTSWRRVGTVAAALVFGTTAMASAQGGRGGGSGGGNAGTAAGALYGDLYVIERDGAGMPITRNVSYPDAETGGTVTVPCVQPLAASCAKLPLWGEQGEEFDPELYDACAVYTPYVDQIQEVKFGRESVSRAPSTVLDKSYAEALKALNSAAAGEGRCDPAEAIRLDPAGRLTLCVASETDGTYGWKTIDAPLENLGLYRAVMSYGCLNSVTEEKVGEEGVRVVTTTALDPTAIFHLGEANLDHLLCPYPGATLPTTIELAQEAEAACVVTPDPAGGTPGPPCWWETPNVIDRTAAGYSPGQGVTREDMLSSAVFIAAGADKFSPVTLDEVVNVNNYLGVNQWSFVRVKKEQVLQIKYFPFKDATNTVHGWFAYTRGADACQAWIAAPLLTSTGSGTFSLEPALPVFAGSPPGVNLEEVGITVCRDGLPLAVNGNGSVVCDSASDPFFGTGSNNGCGGANWFAQAAEDARKTIWYLHNWEAPEIAY